MQQRHIAQLPVIPLWLVWIAAIYFVGYRLGAYPVLNNNEGLYSEIPREMLLASSWKDWVIPHLNGLAYMEKPPLLYWLTAFFFAIFGEQDWVVRLVPAFSALGCVALILWFSTRLQRREAGRLAALMFISSFGVTLMSRILMFDMLLTFFLTAALMSGYLFVEFRDRRAHYLSMVMLAFALLAKGFVALILFTIVMFVYTVFRSVSLKDFFTRIRTWFYWKAVLIFLLIAVPWHIAAMIAEPIFAWFYFINEHILRFLGKREPHDYYAGAWWYYLPRAFLFLFPWSFFLPLLLVRRFKTILMGHLQLFFFAAWFMPLLFFSVSSAKANYYLVIIMPFAVVQMAFILDELQFAQRWVFAVPGVLIVCISAFFLWWLARDVSVPDWIILGMPLKKFAVYGGLTVLMAALIASLMSMRASGTKFISYLLIPAVCLPLLLETAISRGDSISTKALSQILINDFPGRSVVAYHFFEQQSSLPFYLKKPVQIIDSRSSDLFWGNKLHKNQIVIDDVGFIELMRTSKISLLVLSDDLPDFYKKNYASAFQLAKQSGEVSIFNN